MLCIFTELYIQYELKRLLTQALLTAIERQREQTAAELATNCKTADAVKHVGPSHVKKSLRRQINVNNMMYVNIICKLFCIHVHRSYNGID